VEVIRRAIPDSTIVTSPHLVAVAVREFVYSTVRLVGIVEISFNDQFLSWPSTRTVGVFATVRAGDLLVVGIDCPEVPEAASTDVLAALLVVELTRHRKSTSRPSATRSTRPRFFG
jgi:hypothetical protein